MKTVRSKYQDEKNSVDLAEMEGINPGLREKVHTRRADKLPMTGSRDLAHTRSDHFAAQLEAHL